jgi:hypothetical protein
VGSSDFILNPDFKRFLVSAQGILDLHH